MSEKRIYKFEETPNGWTGSVTYKGQTWSLPEGKYYDKKNNLRKWLELRTRGQKDCKFSGKHVEAYPLMIPLEWREKYADLIRKKKFSAYVREAVNFFEKNSGKPLTE